ncbi:MAG TPA: hypothetical protein VGO46_06570 [Gemmatimonadaceae bacterium]|jgi:hypothetical protein|nr:hypothetical protein [Gemmatimonadaceae bacterium]
MATEILVVDGQGHVWSCVYVVTAGGGVASGESEAGTEGQEHYWRCTRDDHSRTISVAHDVSFRELPDEHRTKLIEEAFNISGEWDRR